MHNASRRDPRPDIHYPQMVMNISRHARALACIASVAALLVTAGGALAQNTNSKIANTRHNLSASGSGGVKANATTSGTDQICVFCHTPHAANAAAPGPLWNRNLSTQTYTPYTSNSLDAEDILNNSSIGQPGGASKLCLSCHDGTLAIGQVSNSPGSGSGRTISMTGTRSTASAPFVVGGMPAGSGDTTGYTRNLGINLTNDHPISFTFQNPPPAVTTDVLSQRDGELRSPPYSVSGKVVVGIRSPGTKPMLPLDHEGKVQCTSCHDPHLDASKFLRLNRFQQTASAGITFNPANDQICLGCHDKNKDRDGAAYLAWSNSAHAKTGNEFETYTYTAAASTQREFTANIKVWQAGCLNCHDTHTVQGSRRLLREGTDSTSSPKAGGNPAIEETCYQCHSNSPIIAIPALTATTGVPDIKTEFGRTRKMPITGTEKHDIGGNFNDAAFGDCTTTNNKCGADFLESRTLLGANATTNRHVECTDCHNPHRVIKNSRFTGNGTLQNGTAGTQRTHVAGGADGNIASGALRGIWGVEPIWTAGGNWNPSAASLTYTIKRGDPGSNTATSRGQAYLTREYQLCLKCHSDYGFGTTPPSTTGGSTSNSIGSVYTNIAAELDVNASDTPAAGTDQGEYGACTSGCATTNYTDIEPSGSAPADTASAIMQDQAGVQNHRSWHPIHYPTGRSWNERRIGNTASSNFRAPFNGTTSPNGLGLQTMHCSDCHGHDATWTQGSGPDLTKVQGPHGSSRDFILRDTWSTSTTIGGWSGSGSGLCFNCHNPTAGTSGVGDGSAGGRTSGFNAHSSGASGGHGNGHSGKACMRCHVAVPHGWKNKALLVNLNCRGEENGATTCNITNNFANYPNRHGPYTSGPYYVGAFLRIATWRASGNWTETSCGTYNAADPANSRWGKDWMTDGGTC